MSEIIIGNFSDRDKEEISVYNTPHISPDSAEFFFEQNGKASQHHLQSYLSILNEKAKYSKDEMYSNFFRRGIIRISQMDQVEKIRTRDNLETLKIIYNNKKYDITHFNELFFETNLKIHGLDYSQEFIDIFKELNKNNLTITKAFQKIYKLRHWEDSLSKESDGYIGLYNSEIDEIFETLIQPTFMDSCHEISQEFDKMFHLYSKSTVKDLSVIDGVRFFEWDGGSYTTFNKKSYFEKVLRNTIVNDPESLI